MKKTIILNHKMNLEYDETYEYIDGINKINTNHNLIICPSNIYLETFINNCDWGIGAQNVHYEKEGNYTGEISTLQLKSLGVEYCIVGHYERRKYFHETNKIIKEKMNACLDSNIIPIVCFGSDGKKETITKDLDELLEGIENINFITFAYEPLNIKVNKTIDTIEEDINFIYDYLYSKYKVRPNIIFGGGIKKDNIKETMQIENLDGILIGKISDNINKITKIIENID